MSQTMIIYILIIMYYCIIMWFNTQTDQCQCLTRTSYIYRNSARG